MLRLLVVSCILMLAVITSQGKVPSTLPFSSIRVKGELQERLERNFQRLEEEKYQPHKVFLSMQQSGDWPGDTEGRTILGLVMDAQASHRSPLYLDEIMHRLPEHLNECGYMGPVFHDCLHEQQLSGNGWLLRGLCEYYLWRKDERVLDMIRNISEQLFISGKDYYGDYPIDPMARQTGVGKASGNISQHIDRWQLSSDIGCVFIGMDGPDGAIYLTEIDVKWETATTAKCNIAAACTDGASKYYGTYSNGNAFVVPSGLTVSAIKVDGDDYIMDEGDSGKIYLKKVSEYTTVAATEASED